MSRLWRVSVVLADPPHPYSNVARLTVVADTTREIYDFVAEKYPSGVVMGIWPAEEATPTPKEHQ